MVLLSTRYVRSFFKLHKILLILSSLSFLTNPITAQEYQSKLIIDSLLSVPETSPYFPFAQQRLAGLYLEHRTVNTRKTAEVCARKAISADPKNINFRLTLIRILYERASYLAVKEECDKIISNHHLEAEKEIISEAHYYKGLCIEKQAFKYNKMISFVQTQDFGGRGPVAVPLTDYGEIEMKNAFKEFESSLEFNPFHRDAMFHLGLLYYERNNYPLMISLFEKAIQLNPSDKEAYTFAALGYYLIGRFEKTNEYFQNAMNLMGEEELGEFNYIGYIVPAKEMKEYLKGATSLTKAFEFEKQFWKKKDPLYLTGYNERQLAHYCRMTYANLRFGVPRLNLAGWNTERGMIYIRYGQPLNMYTTQPDENALGGKETWNYRGFSFTFEDQYASGKYLLNDRSYFVSRGVYNTIEDLFSLPTIKTIPLKSRAYQFKGGRDRLKIQGFYKLLIAPQYDSLSIESMEADKGMFVLNNTFDVVAEKRSNSTLKIDDQKGLSCHGSLTLNIDDSVRVNYYSIEIQSSGKYMAVSRNSLSKKDFMSDRLTLSDVILADMITGRGDLKITPSFNDTFSVDKNLFLYFEVYNLLLDNESTGHYKVNTRILPQSRKGVLGSLGNLLSNSSEGLVGSSFDVTSYSRDDSYYLGLNLFDIPPGMYNLVLHVTDLMANVSVEQIFPITIVRNN